MPLFRVEDLSYFYPEAEYPALQKVNLEVEEGEFLLVVGGSGSGKSSLARALVGLIPDFYGGKIGGKLLFKEQDLRFIDRRSLAKNIGIVFQDPEKQLVMTSVEMEIAFGLENLGLSQPEMFRRVAEVMSFFGITALKREFTANLSGGQKQKLALASVLAMQPSVLILDEPTSQVDPLAAEEIFNLIKRMNEELNLTIILIEQRLERCFHLADRLVVMEGGRIVKDGTAGEIAAWEVQNGFPFVPPVAGFFSGIDAHDIPLTIKEGRKLLKKKYFLGNKHLEPTVPPLQPTSIARKKTAYKIYPYIRDSSRIINSAIHTLKRKCISAFFSEQRESMKMQPETPVAQIKKLWYTYPNGREALRGIDFSILAGEFVAILGENGSGKTTILKQLAGLIKPSRGQVMIMGADTSHRSPQQLARMVAYLSQNPNDYLFHDTVKEELEFTQTNLGLSDNGMIEQVLDRLGLYCHQHVNPRDLSSGERQRVALGSVLVACPQLLVLDEPTRGLDHRLKAELGSLLQEIAQTGVSIILVTHDVEFATEYTERVVMLFDGRIACDGPRNLVLGSSMFYAPQIRRLFQGIDDEVFTLREAVGRVRPLLVDKLLAK